MTKKPVLLKLLIFCLAFSLSLTACTPAKKPFNNDGTVADARAAKVSQAAESVEGVGKAVTVISSNAAYIGLDLEPGTENDGENIEKRVASKAKKVDPTLNTFYVTSNWEAVARLKEISQEIAAGKPVTDYTRDLDQIKRGSTSNTI